MEGLCELAAYQQRKVCIFAMQLRITEAVTINGDNAIRIFCNHIAIRIHAEGTHNIVIQLGAIQNFCFVNLICNMLKDLRRHLHAHADIYLVVDKIQTHFAALLCIPFRTGTTRSSNQIGAGDSFTLS